MEGEVGVDLPDQVREEIDDLTRYGRRPRPTCELTVPDRQLSKIIGPQLSGDARRTEEYED